jgi:hypothetical protein
MPLFKEKTGRLNQRVRISIFDVLKKTKRKSLYLHRIKLLYFFLNSIKGVKKNEFRLNDDPYGKRNLSFFW